MKLKLLLFIFLTGVSAVFAQNNYIENIKINTEDGWTLNAKWRAPKKNNNVFLLIHGQKSNLNEWEKWFKEIENYGLGFLAVDLRGHGFSNISPEGSTVSFKSFATSGLDNEYNKMIRDIDAAVIWISSQGISENRIIPVGSWLGGNLAIKYGAINKNIPMVVSIYPSMNINDVLIVNPIRAYGKRPILFVSSSKYEKKYKELQLLNDIAKLSCGKENVFTIIERELTGPKDTMKTTIRKIIEWTMSPTLPEAIEYKIPLSTYTIIGSSSNLKASSQENEQNED
jgi:alpha-beta hydrolase superfamily lysophospholipase